MSESSIFAFVFVSHAISIYKMNYNTDIVNFFLGGALISKILLFVGALIGSFTVVN